MKSYQMAVGAIAVLAGMCFIAPASADQENQLQSLREENAKLKAQVAELTAANAALVQKVAALEHSNETLVEVNEDLTVQKKNLTELAGMTPEGKRVQSRRALIEILYNDKEQKTIVRSKAEKLIITRGSGADHFMSTAYSYPGKEMQSPPQNIRWYIQTKFSGGIYHGRKNVKLNIDGESYQAPIINYDARRRSTGMAGRRRTSSDDETLTIQVDAKLLRALGRATSVTCQISHVHFELTPDQIATFTAMRKRIELAEKSGDRSQNSESPDS